MRSGFIRVNLPMADPDPAPEPTPFPIRIVSDPPPPPPSADLEVDLATPARGKRYDEFYRIWDKFLSVEPNRAKKTSRAAHEVDEERKAVERTPGDGLQIEENAARSWEQAAAECRIKVAAIVEECMRLNQKYRDAIFDLEANPYCIQSLNGRYPKAVEKIEAPPWIKRLEDIFDDPQFFVDGATATDVHQGSGGDCWFLASLMAVSAKKELIDKLCVARDEKVGVYGFVFYRDGEWVHEVIDDKLFLRVGDDDDLQVVRDWDKEEKSGMPIKYDDEKLKLALQRGGLALYFSHCKSHETWLPLIEKAYAKAHGDYTAIEGGFASEGIEDLTGGVAVVLNPEDIMDKDRFWKEQLFQVNKKYLFGGGSKPTTSRGVMGGHAYAVLEAWEEGDLRLLKLRNPWGEVEWEGDWSDGSKLWTAEMMLKLNHTFGNDGIFWISYKDFLKHFPSINRVRLFDETWSVAQQWTCVSVPWTVDYLDTSFQFSISERGPVVVVLAQPDDRYFYGMRGRYLYSMHFRVYKEGGDERWLVRSMHNSGNETVFTRSVSAELADLEPGTYNVIFKVTAVRSNVSATAKEVITKFAVERKEKLLHVGRRYDYAQTKGNLRAMEEAMRRQKKQERKDQRKSGWKKNRKLNQQDRERARRRKARVDDAMRERRKAFHQQQRERAQAREAKRQRAMAKRSSAAPQRTPSPGRADDGDDKADGLTPKSSEELAPAVDKPDGQGDALQVPSATSTGTGTTKVEDQTAAPEEKLAEKPEQKNDPPTQELADRLSGLKMQASQTSPDSRPTDPISPMEPFDDDDDEYESPLEPPEELEDDDFDWDSEIDGPTDSSSDTDDTSSPPPGGRSKSSGDIFADDPWNALCVLGLRVYSQSKDVHIRVLKAEGGS